jgi:hypothetical protein
VHGLGWFGLLFFWLHGYFFWVACSSCSVSTTFIYTYTTRLPFLFSVSILTTPGGLAYYAANIYFSSWLSLASCVYTLDRWTSAKDIISIQELTQLSATLKSWYALFLVSLIAFGSAVSLHIYFDGTQTGSTAFCISLGLVSTAIALFFILVHYKFFTDCCTRVKQGGWLELSAAFFLILCWTTAYVHKRVNICVYKYIYNLCVCVCGCSCEPYFMFGFVL